MAESKNFSIVCPTPIMSRDHVQLAHGGGGKLMHDLLEQVVVPAFRNPLLEQRHDGAVMQINGARLAFTTDSYVVRPLFFPGGDIGTLAVNGTVNDLAMCGARPLYLSAALILEEGLPMETLQRVVESMSNAARAASVQFVTGDTKVVDKGKGDGIFVNTAGIGVVEHNLIIAPASVRPGDAVIVSGDVGRHGIAIMALREGLQFETTITSDCAPLAAPVQGLLDAGIEIHCLRDATRGGMATTLIEIAEGAAAANIEINEPDVPVQEDVAGACEILGFDPLYLANEGCMLVFVPQAQAEQTISILRQHEPCRNATLIGSVNEGRGLVTLKNSIGTRRVLDMLTGEQLPRIC
jgi:hydrogenase expression/formation protein HypE